MEHEKFRAKLSNFVKDSKDSPIIWSFKPRIVFDLFDLFLERLYDMKHMFETANEFMKLEKVEIGGVKAKQINRSLQLVSSLWYQLFWLDIYKNNSFEEYVIIF